MASQSPLVSLVVVSYNEIGHIQNSLTALEKQTYPRYEVIVFDNHSSDGTPDYVAEHFPHVRLVRSTENLGFGGANNEAAKIARGKYIGFLNCDAAVAPGWLEPIICLLEEDSRVGCVGAELMCSENREIILSHGTGIHLSGVSYARDRGQKARERGPIEVGGISGGAFLIDREFFLQMGGFESPFFLYYEDTDLSLRVRLQGKKCMVMPGAYVYHNCESRFSPRKLFFLERNRYLSLFSLMSPWMLFLMAPSMLVFEMFAWGYCLLSGRTALANKVQAWQAIFRQWGWIRARRKKFASNRAPDSYVLQAFTPRVYLDYVHSNRIWSDISFLTGYILAAPVFFFLRLFTGKRYLE